MPDANGNPTVEELQAQLRAVAQERDQYRQQAQGNQPGYTPQPNAHVLGRVLGVDGDFSAVDQYYVQRSQYQQELQRAQQEAINRAYAMARGDMMVLRQIDKATGQYKDLSSMDTPLAKKTLEILQKENYASPRQQGQAPKSWEDLVYQDVNALSRAARIAQAEIVMEQQQQQQSAQDAQSKQDAASVVSGEGVNSTGGAGTGKVSSVEEAFAAIDRGDTASLDAALKTG